MAGPLAAQDPPEPPPDTVPAVADTAAADTAGPPVRPGGEAAADTVLLDSVQPIPELVVFGEPEAGGWADGAWVWDRDALLASGAFTLADLLERVPGVTTVRAGYYGMPQVATAFGLTGGRVELFMDGYALDPLGAAAVDLSYIALNALERVRIERGPGALRIRIETLEPDDKRPFSMIQAGRGDRLNAELFRGLFLAPNVLHGRLSLGIERLKTAGLGRNEPATLFAGWLKWGLIGDDSSGVQLEYRRGRLTRSDTLYAGEATREDWVVRGRKRLTPDLTAEAFAGLSSLAPPEEEDDDATSLLPATGGAVVDSAFPAEAIRVPQAGLRARYDADPVWTGATLRVRRHEALPTLDVRVDGGVRLPSSLRLDGGVRMATWPEGGSTTSFEVRSRWTPWSGIGAFAEYSSGTAGVPFSLVPVDVALAPDSAGAPSIGRRTGARAGLRLEAGGFALGVAGMTLDTDSVRPFGLPFEHRGRGYPGGDVRGYEIDVRVPTFWDPLWFEASHTEWTGGSRWIYLPQRVSRAAVVFHDLPLESENLELFARLEGSHRGVMAVPAGAEAAVTDVPASTLLDFYFQLRIHSVRAFFRWENILHRLDLYDVPGRRRAGQRILYGVKWYFWN